MRTETSAKLVDRLRGRYAVGPSMPDGQPEFGWRNHQTPPIQHEAAAEIERLTDIIRRAVPAIERHWFNTAGGPQKSELLALRRSAEEVASK